MRHKIHNLEAQLREKERNQKRDWSTHATQLQNVTDEAMRVKRAAQERENQHQRYIAELKSHASKGKRRATMQVDSDGDDEEDSDDDEEAGLFNIPSPEVGRGTDEEMDKNVGAGQVCPHSRTKYSSTAMLIILILADS